MKGSKEQPWRLKEINEQHKCRIQFNESRAPGSPATQPCTRLVWTRTNSKSVPEVDPSENLWGAAQFASSQGASSLRPRVLVLTLSAFSPRESSNRCAAVQPEDTEALSGMERGVQLTA